MEKQTIKSLGGGLREELALPEDLPSPIREALKALTEAETAENKQGLHRRSSELRRSMGRLGLSLTEWHDRTKDNPGCA